MNRIHILTGPITPTEKEEKQLAALDKYQKRFLKGFMCSMCHQSLGRKQCGTVYRETACDQETRMRRRENCLKEYKPRLNRRK